MFSKKYTKGFTLIEVIVSLAIMLLATGLLLGNYPDSNMRLTLLNNTHTYALLIREAQIRGSAIDFGDGSIGGYGVFIEKATPKQAILFADNVNFPGGVTNVNKSGLKIGDGLYTVSSPTESTDDKIKRTLK